MRITPTPAASAAKRVPARREWRPLTTGEAVVAVVVDVLLLVIVVLVPLLALNVRALPWILLFQVIAVQSLVLARFGRTAGLATVSATAVVPQQGAAPGIGRALARVLLAVLLPIRVGRQTTAGQHDGDGEHLLDRLTGTLTVTRRPAPSQERQRQVSSPRGERRRGQRGSRDGAPSSMRYQAAAGQGRRDRRRRSSSGSVASGPPMLQPQTPPVRERPDLAGPGYAGAPGGAHASVGANPAAVGGAGGGRSRFAPPVAPPAAAAPPPSAPLPPVASESPAPSPAVPSAFAAPPGPPPTSSIPTRPASFEPASPGSPTRPASFEPASPGSPTRSTAPVETSAPLPPSLPPRIQPGRRQTVAPIAPSGRPAAPSAGGTHAGDYAGAHRAGPSDSGGPAAPPPQPPAVQPVVPPGSHSPQQQPMPPVSGRPDPSAPASGPASVQPGRRPGRSDAQRRRPMVS
ncbi:Uncharacterised protein [Actinomyces viscosus]|uniref:RDD family n=1 Tax=Actinomyces viscosus TaxID=1656 RepID=A0A3S4VKU8_ACTVI|nr:Uncharacterised protein [Actinomyces viscosus]